MNALTGEAFARGLHTLWRQTPKDSYGNENGMQGGNDPDCRRPMTWDQEQWQPDIREAVTRLVKLRNQHDLLRRGAVETAFANDRTYAYYRRFDGHSALVILNNAAASRKIRIPVDFPENTALRDGLCNHKAVTVPDGFIERPS